MKKLTSMHIVLGMLFLMTIIFLWNCQHDPELPNTKTDANTFVLNRVSIQKAKSLFTDYLKEKQQKESRLRSKSKEESLVVAPLWNTYTEKLEDSKTIHAQVQVMTNIRGEVSSKIIFLNINNQLYQFLETKVYQEKGQNNTLIEGRIFYHDLYGNFIDAYKVEAGKVSKRLFLKSTHQQASFLGLVFFQTNCGDGVLSLGNLDGTCLDEVNVPANPPRNNNVALYHFLVNSAKSNIFGSGGGGSRHGSGGNPNGKCAGIKVKNSLGQCVCPKGYVENIDGKCIKKCETTVTDLQKVFTKTKTTKLKVLADHINKHGKDYGLDTDDKLQHFLTQAAHEATNPVNGIEFDTFEENLNYRWQKLGTKDYWDEYFNPITAPTANPNKADPRNFKRNGISKFVDIQKFANHVYNDTYRRKTQKLGNVRIGDGYKFRGRGIFQLTGRHNYQTFTLYYQLRYKSTLDFTKTPDLIANDSEIAVISALWYFKTRVLDKLKPPINKNTSVKKITRLINTEEKGLSHRQIIYSKTKINVNCK